jgi:hypothetical protein
MRKIAAMIGLVAAIIASPFIVYWLKNPGVNLKYTVKDQHTCIYRGPHEQIQIGEFDINYIENCPSDCINPNYPSIHITTSADHNAWLHVVRTDTIDPQTGQPNWTFIDSHESIYPFYTCGTDFYDAPCWNSSLLAKPLGYWKGHAYAVSVDYENSTIQFVGGIEWGFTWSTFGFSPTAIPPRVVTEQERLADWKIFETALVDYIIVGKHNG